MGTINNAFVLGHLGIDPTIRLTSSGAKVAELSVATHRRIDANDKTAIETTWHRIKLWGTKAELAETHLTKGDAVAIGGRLSTEAWTDANGQPQRKTFIVGQHVTLLGGSRRADPRGVADIQPSQ